MAAINTQIMLTNYVSLFEKCIFLIHDFKMELSEDSTIIEFDAQNEESANEIDNVSVTMISSDDSDEYVHENSYMSKDKNTNG